MNLVILAAVLVIGLAIVTIYIVHKNSRARDDIIRLDASLAAMQNQIKIQTELLNKQFIELQKNLDQHRERFSEKQMAVQKILQETLQKGVNETRAQLKESLNDYSSQVVKRVETLNQTTDTRLKEINAQVEKRLAAGFDKTTETFTQVIKRLAHIDEAQKRITELSNNVVSLQEILSDKRSRGTFGEVQLTALIRNVIPENNFALQHTFSNNKRADCVLFLPPPTGNIAIDAKFPLESFKQLMNKDLSDNERKIYEQSFRNDIKHHINSIAEKYIVPGETADGAMMFIPSESIFAEIHAYFPDLVETAHKMKVWIVSPTTMMAILTTARAVLKDAATRKQVHIIQEHLNLLATDFTRFTKRMDNLARHIEQAHSDVGEVHTSARKISNRFNRIEKVEFVQEKVAELE